MNAARTIARLGLQEAVRRRVFLIVAVLTVGYLALYGLGTWQAFDEITNEDDTQMNKNGVTLLIDAMSLQYLVGAEIDYKDDLEGSQFVIRNPNATTTCGCGSSFSV